MRTLAYYNGKISETDEMMIPINDRANWFGDGVYEATLCGNYTIFCLEEHVERFFKSAELLSLQLNFSKEELKKLLNDLVQKLDTPDQLVYWQVSRGTESRNHVFPRDNQPNLTVTLKSFSFPDMTGKIRLRTEKDIRYQMCHIKTLNLIPNVMASQRAKEAGCYETVFYRDGLVTECAHSNIHIIKKGIFKTAPADHQILAGIARAHLIRHCRLLGIPVVEQAFTLAEMMDADEIIVSSSGNFCVAAYEIDGIPVGGKNEMNLTQLQTALSKEFYQETNQKISDTGQL